MEKNVPGLKKLYHIHLSRLRISEISADEANRRLAYWSAKYIESVLEGDNLEFGVGVYGSILDAYARREALKQYIEELKGSQNNVRT